MRQSAWCLSRAAISAGLLLTLLSAPPARAAATGPTIFHEPVPYAAAGQPIALTAFALCEQRPMNQACAARVFFRNTPAGSPAELLGTGDPAWSSVVMNRDPGINMPAASQTLYSFTVPRLPLAADTRGVDYIIKVTDGSASSYSPGTAAAQGIGQNSGMRSGAYHVFVTSPVNVVAVPVATATFHAALPVSASATCSGACSARLFFRRTGLLQPSALDLGDPPYNPAEGTDDVQWTSIPMAGTSPLENPTIDQYGGTTHQFTATIPAAYVDTRGVDYAIKVTDGHTRSWWPGTTYNGYVAPTDGARIGWQHVLVLAPVMAQHVQTTYSTTRGISLALTVQALCWTSSCSASVKYYSFGGPLLTAGMSVVAKSESGGATLITYGVTIPGTQVVSPMLSYSFQVGDGYTTAFSPGTAYNGYYAKLDGHGYGAYMVAVF